MVVNGSSRFNGNGKHSFEEDRLDGAYSEVSTSKPVAVSSSATEYCNYNIKSETVTPGLPGRSGTGYPIW